MGLEFRLEILSVHSHWIWKEMAFLYQLSMVEGTVSIDMIQCMRGDGMPAEKYLIRMFWSVMPAREE